MRDTTDRDRSARRTGHLGTARCGPVHGGTAHGGTAPCDTSPGDPTLRGPTPHCPTTDRPTTDRPTPDDPTPDGRAWPPALRRACRLLLPAALALITWLALTPLPPPQADTGWDKANHLLAFATLALLAEGSVGPRRRARMAAAAALLAYGALIELAQSQLPPRSGEWADLLADALGIAAGLGLAAAASGVRG